MHEHELHQPHQQLSSEPLLDATTCTRGRSGTPGTEQEPGDLPRSIGVACPQPQRSASSLQQPCSLPTLSGSLCPALGQPLAAPGQRSLGSSSLRVGVSILRGGFSIFREGFRTLRGGFSILLEGYSILGEGLQHPLAPRTPNLAETCLVPTTLRVLPGDTLTPTALGARLSPAQGQIGSVPPARREIRRGVGSCWYHLLN